MKIKFSMVISILLVCSVVKSQDLTDLVCNNDWEAGQYDISNQWMGGTETVQITAHKGQLFAAIVQNMNILALYKHHRKLLSLAWHYIAKGDSIQRK